MTQIETKEEIARKIQMSKVTNNASDVSCSYFNKVLKSPLLRA